MSEFFKALEQAERDRLRDEHTEATVMPPPRVSSPSEATAPKLVESVRPPHPVEKERIPQPLMPESSPATTFRPSLRAPQLRRLMPRIGGRQPVLITQIDPGGVAAEAYRTVRANIELMADDAVMRRIVITSAAGGDGKSTTAANLAVVGAQGGRRVCLIDADLRHPTLHDVFGLPNVEGFTAALEQGKPLHAVARATDVPNLSVVVAGHGSRTFQDIVTPQRFTRTLVNAETEFDFLIFDSAPVVVADTLTIATMCDGVIVVVRSGAMSFSAVRRSIEQIRQVKARVLGVLLNQASARSAGDAYRHYRAYHTNGNG